MSEGEMLQILRENLRRLEADVQTLRDREEIRDCLIRNSRGLDRHDDELLASSYHPDATDHHGAFVGPPAEFIPWARELHEAGWNAHTHLLSNNSVEIDGDAAHSEAYFYTVLRNRNGQLDLRGGRYIDRLERRAGTWRITARAVVLEWAATTDASTITEAIPTGSWDREDASYQRPLRVPITSGPFLGPAGGRP
jgi:hypothetical protein